MKILEQLLNLGTLEIDANFLLSGHQNGTNDHAVDLLDPNGPNGALSSKVC